MRKLIVLLVCGSCLALTACGGGGGGGPVVVGMPNVPGFTGTIWSDLTVQHMGAVPGAGVWVGDNVLDQTMRAFYRFDLSSIPAGATIEQAQFVVGQEPDINNPYPLLGVVHVDHVALGIGFTGADYNSGVLTLNVATLSADDTVQAKSALLTNQVIADLNAARTTIDIRLRFTIPTAQAGLANFAVFNSHTNMNGAGNGVLPTLTVTYREP